MAIWLDSALVCSGFLEIPRFRWMAEGRARRDLASGLPAFVSGGRGSLIPAGELAPARSDHLMYENEKDCIRSAHVRDGRVLAGSSASIADTIR